MKFVRVIAILSSTIFALSCEKELCQSPPPRYNFAFVNSQDQSIANDSSQAATLRLTYVSSNGPQIAVPQAEFKPVVSNDKYRFVYNVSYDLFAKSEQNQYTVEVGGKVVGNLALTSRKNNSK